jgi:GDP-4-dehydro-6-deoxy-D-mannose reductase
MTCASPIRCEPNRPVTIDLALSQMISTCNKSTYKSEVAYARMVKTVGPRRILITGAAGFVGGWLLRRLETGARGGFEIFAGAREGEIPLSLAKTVRLDINDRDEVDEVLRSVKPSAVIHLAALSTVKEAREAPRRAWEVNLHGTMNIAESILEHCPQSVFVFVSTSEVYGGADRCLDYPLNEAARLDPLNPYAASKAAADLMVGQMAHEGLNAIRVRPFNHTGPWQTERFVIPAFAAQVARIEAGLQEPVIRVGNLDTRRDFLDVRDVADAYIGLAISPHSFQAGMVLNLASGIGRRIGDILEELVSLSPVKIRVETDPARLRANETRCTIADASQIRALLGWEPRIPWPKTLADVLEFWRMSVRRSSPP